jgi:hypothetical protein
MASPAPAHAPETGLGPRVIVTSSLPVPLRAGDHVTIAGRVNHAPAGARIALETSRSRGWTVAVQDTPGVRGAFRLRWLIPDADTGLLYVRTAALLDGRVVAATKRMSEIIGQPVVRCSAPAPPAAVPAGDGWIVGGLYIEGGAFAGLDQCSAGAYSVTATRRATGAATTVGVAGGHSYTIVLPAGAYTLTPGCGVPTEATVVAGHQAVANTRCLVPISPSRGAAGGRT